MRACADAAGYETIVAFMQDPGSAGVNEAQATTRALDGYNVRFRIASGGKEMRAKLASAQAEAGNLKIVRGLWNDEFLGVLEKFPAGSHDNEVDGLSGAYETVGGCSWPFEYERIFSPRTSRRFGDVAALGACRGGGLVQGQWCRTDRNAGGGRMCMSLTGGPSDDTITV